MWQVIALSFGLAMDATAVSAARGLAGRILGERLGARLSALGGLALIGIGIDLLVQGL